MTMSNQRLSEQLDIVHFEGLRGKAEHRLRSSGSPASVDPVPDAKRLLHDLQVHQVELEIQNEELRRARFELEESRDSYYNLFELSPIGYLSLDADLLVIRANAAAAELLREDKEALIGRTISRFMNTVQADAFYLHCRKARATGRRETCEIQLVLPNDSALSSAGLIGSGLTVQLHTVLLRSQDGGQETFQIAVSDITAADEARQVLRRAQSVLEKRVRERTVDLEIANRTLVNANLESRKLSSAVNQSRSTIVITDSEGGIEYVNPRFTELTGYTLEEVRGKKLDVLSAGTAFQERSSEMWATISSGREWRGILQNRRKNGETFWEELCFSSIADECGKISNYLGVGEDVTARRAAEEKQQLLMAELDHRVKNTLSVVLSLAKQTLRTTSDFATFRSAFEGRLMALAQVHRLLTKNRWGAVLLDELVNMAVKPYTDISGPKAVVKGPPIRLGPKDAQSLHLIFHELSTNAAKYGAFVGPSGSVDVSWETEKGVNGAITVHLRWSESGGPEVTAPSKTGFGHELIERTVVSGLDGTSVIEFLPSGLEWKASFPLPDVAVLMPLFTSGIPGD